MAKAVKDTPLMAQHRSIKQKYPDAILLFRVGDFYETFGEDAVLSSRILGITLTKRNNGAAASSELAGFPHHALETYLHKLVKAGHRVAICDQLEDPKTVKGIVKRGVTEMVTPGIATHDKLLDHNHNNFLSAIHFGEREHGIAFLDISTGEFFVASGNDDYIDKLLQSLQPAEVLFQRSYLKKFRESFGNQFYTYTLDGWIFDEHYAQESLLKQFQTHSLKGFGLEGAHPGIIAAGAILHYLKETEHPNWQHLTSIQRLEREDFLWMDRFTVRNLELLPLQEGAHSLLQVTDQTVNAMGSRLLKRWMLFPLRNPKDIRERLEVVAYLIKETDLRKQLINAIRACGDLERLSGKIPNKKIGPREVQQLGKGLLQTSLIKKSCNETNQPLLQKLGDGLNNCQVMVEKIHAVLADQAPATATKGGMIREGVHAELDQLRSIAHGGKEYLQQIQRQEAEKTGISSLKINFNQVFGYYLEVTHAHKEKVPDTWIRKQTLVNAERYITPELKEYEEKIIGAEEKILAIESGIYDQLLNDLQLYIAPLQVNGNILATLDCLCCFAENAIRYNYHQPELHEGFELFLEESRHPVIERFLPPGTEYVTNDIVLNPADTQIIILTGPNMSGKSALLRQTALITLLAHMGSFVPARKALIPLTDKIFTRVGASDNLSGGESTFMVEMNETASIINNVSERSLVLLDEIGRGTSTYDGISIAWSIVEYLQQSTARPKTLFATHYHELNELENKCERVHNYHITHKEAGNKIIFLRKLARGGSTHSFGIHVARMAGMPTLLIERAYEILQQLENKQAEEGQQITPEHKSSSLTNQVKKLTIPQMQLSIFDSHTQTFDSIRKLLSEIDINRLTPVEALMKLNEIKKMIQ
ncbi:MAG: DNA mismatch repair protein MutS [Bacteroidota bacterium]|jgi:DNA mismatch repair protein MutS